jgi:hypothetical protein
MKEKSVYSYYCFGFNYYILKEKLTKKTNKEMSDQLKRLYLNYIEDLSLPVTKKVVQNLYEIINQMELKDSKEIVTDETLKNITEIINAADKTLDAELMLKKTYSLTPKRIDIDKLIKTPDELLANGVWDLLSEQCKTDFSEACKCIAFNMPTACAFHTMRAVEEMVRQLYVTYVRQNRMSNPMWGPILEKLKKKKSPKPTLKTIEHLDMIRSTYRNPTQHPDKNFSIDEAQDLLYSSIVAINEIVTEIKKR